MRAHLTAVVWTLLLSTLPTGVVHAQSNPAAYRPEVQRLCQKWDGILVLPSRPEQLRCEHIRVQFERAAKNGTIFAPIRRMIESVRGQSLLNLKATDLPKDQKCAIEKGSTTILTCTTLDFQPEVSTRIVGTKSGLPTSASVSADLDWYRKQVTREIQKQYGAPPTPAFLEYYEDLLVTVGTSLGGANERYSMEGKRLVMRLILR